MKLFSALNRLKRATGTQPGPLNPDTWNALCDYVEELEKRVNALVPGNSPDIGWKISNQGLTAWLKKRPRSGPTVSSAPCLFGSLITTEDDPPVTAILGGLLTCGDQNFNLSDQPIDLGTAGEWLISITLTGIECATDDDGEIFLPGVITATGTPAWDSKAWTDSTDYDPTTNPTSPATPTGDIVIPLGRLKVADGAATFSPVGCGPITVHHCAGILSHTRG